MMQVLHTVTVTVSDGLLSDSQAITITVVEKNKEPLAISNLTAASGETYEIVENGLQNGVMVYIDRRLYIQHSTNLVARYHLHQDC